MSGEEGRGNGRGKEAEKERTCREAGSQPGRGSSSSPCGGRKKRKGLEWPQAAAHVLQSCRGRPVGPSPLLWLELEWTAAGSRFERKVIKLRTKFN